MSFSRKFNTLIENSKGNLLEISYTDGVEIVNRNHNNSILNKKKLGNIKKSFSVSYFDIDEKNNIYGILLDPKDTLIYVYIHNNHIYKTKIFSFDCNRYKIDFPYIKKINNSIHLFYYLVDIEDANSCTLVHYYNDGSKWKQYNLDVVNYFILTNFVIIWDDYFPSIFYINKINGYDEIVMSKFNYEKKLWSSIIKVTNSKKIKVYLSVLKDKSNLYHIVYCENNDDKYHCTYNSGYINNNGFNITGKIILKETIACEFPTISLIHNILYCQWLEYDNIQSFTSSDNGVSWIKSKTLQSGNDDYFIRYDYRNNITKTSDFILNNFFASEDKLLPIGFPKNIISHSEPNKN